MSKALPTRCLRPLLTGLLQGSLLAALASLTACTGQKPPVDLAPLLEVSSASTEDLEAYRKALSAEGLTLRITGGFDRAAFDNLGALEQEYRTRWLKKRCHTAGQSPELLLGVGVGLLGRDRPLSVRVDERDVPAPALLVRYSSKSTDTKVVHFTGKKVTLLPAEASSTSAPPQRNEDCAVSTVGFDLPGFADAKVGTTIELDGKQWSVQGSAAEGKRLTLTEQSSSLPELREYERALREAFAAQGALPWEVDSLEQSRGGQVVSVRTRTQYLNHQGQVAELELYLDEADHVRGNLVVRFYTQASSVR